MKKKYCAKEIWPGVWHVIGPRGIAVFDNEPDGNDRPHRFKDEDDAIWFANKMNSFLNEHEPS